jgi:predicted Zn finger-like uncharacterized protein
VYTRCPGCHTVHPVNADVLAQANGRVRCGKCNKVSNALDSLFDSWPTASQKPAQNYGSDSPIPDLSGKIDMGSGAATQSGEQGTEPADSGNPDRKSVTDWRNSRLWIAAALILAIVTAINLVSLGNSGLAESSGLNAALRAMGLKEAPPAPPFSDTSQIEIVSRDMKVHQARRNALILSATLVNRAHRSQPFPVFEVILLDSKSIPIASRRFKPGEYLGPDSDPDEGMTPGAFLAVSMELVDPGSKAVGFELLFHNALSD